MIAQGTSDQLKSQIGGERVEVVVATHADIPAAQKVLEELCVGEVRLDEQVRRATAPVVGGLEALEQLISVLKDRDVPVVDVGLRRPTLDDVFLTLTGHSAEEVAQDGEGQEPKDAKLDDEREKEVVS